MAQVLLEIHLAQPRLAYDLLPEPYFLVGISVATECHEPYQALSSAIGTGLNELPISQGGESWW